MTCGIAAAAHIDGIDVCDGQRIFGRCLLCTMKAKCFCLLCHSMFSTLSTLSCLGMAVRSESNSHKAQCVRISIWDDGRHVGLFFCTQIYQVNLFKSCIHRKSHCDLSVLYVQSMYANTYIYICIFCTFFYPKTVNCVNLCDCHYNFCTKN